MATELEQSDNHDLHDRKICKESQERPRVPMSHLNKACTDDKAESDACCEAARIGTSVLDRKLMS